MAIIIASVIWDPRNNKITGVRPDPAPVRRATNDVLVWSLDDGGDSTAKIESVAFGADKPFNSVAPDGRGYVGSGIGSKNGLFKYTVTVANVAGTAPALDPVVDVDDGP